MNFLIFLYFLGMYQGSDKADNLRIAFEQVAKQFRDLMNGKFTLPFPNSDGTLSNRPLKFFLIGS